MNHTAGPWKALHQFAISVIHGPNGEHIADTGAWRDDEHPEMRANAELIASAPELLSENERLKARVKELTEVLEEVQCDLRPGFSEIAAAVLKRRADAELFRRDLPDTGD